MAFPTPSRTLSGEEDVLPLLSRDSMMRASSAPARHSNGNSRRRGAPPQAPMPPRPTAMAASEERISTSPSSSEEDNFLPIFRPESSSSSPPPQIPQPRHGSTSSSVYGNRRPSSSVSSSTRDRQASPRMSNTSHRSSVGGRRPSHSSSTASPLMNYSLFPTPSHPPPIGKPLPPLPRSPPPPPPVQQPPAQPAPPWTSSHRASSSAPRGSLEEEFASSVSINDTTSRRSVRSSSTTTTSTEEWASHVSLTSRYPANADSYPSGGPHGSSSEAPPSPLQRRNTGTGNEHHITAVHIVPRDQLVTDKKSKDEAIYYLDVSPTASILSSKHGGNVIRIWPFSSHSSTSSLSSSSPSNRENQDNTPIMIKITSFSQARTRSRSYFIRSHALLSETQNLLAMATKFGTTLEIYDWTRKKCVQTIDKADRWAAAPADAFGNNRTRGWCPLACYSADMDTIRLYSAVAEGRDGDGDGDSDKTKKKRLKGWGGGGGSSSKQPFSQSQSIDLRKAKLPFLPKYPELAFSPTGPLLVAAAGPRPPATGQPPPEKETLLMAWEIRDGAVSDAPFNKVWPRDNPELDSALPYCLATYGSVVLSVWIPAPYRVAPVPGGSGLNSYTIVPVQVTERHVLVWDLASGVTQTYSIPDTTACISPDCRFVAYCVAAGASAAGRRGPEGGGCLVILDAITGNELWSHPPPPGDSWRPAGLEQLEETLSRVSELTFSADGRTLYLGDTDGRIGVYDVRESSDDRGFYVDVARKPSAS